ncbi:hypothetical protein [Kibdelosporangium aridum]|uniref:SnoaL-like domain-containing protein n=1 Tax=Kibdelosporangium aridum TaxID=2030 RepID=A0A1W2FYP2_KIBAR|nr:hypothetical protein [Kibdelosporangium aridum]SMD27079.1 hypothetical protein SAMN05661093_10676 [Kibdelosporangium aridum]
MIGGITEVSRSSMQLVQLAAPMLNGDLVATNVHFTATRDDAKVSLGGLDLFRIEDSKIVEVWLFSAAAGEAAEKKFWLR